MHQQLSPSITNRDLQRLDALKAIVENLGPIGSLHLWQDSLQTVINPWYEPSCCIPHLSSQANDEWLSGIPVHAIGSCGWNWRTQCSEWVAFDFDSKHSHPATGLNTQSLGYVTDILLNIPCAELTRSRSGHGIHCRVFLPPKIQTTLPEHTGLALMVLQSFDLALPRLCDIAGTNVWLWHENMTADAFTVLKRADEPYPLDVLKLNWPIRQRFPLKPYP